MLERRSAGPQLPIGALLFLLGCFWVALESAAWYSSQEAYALYDQQRILSLVESYYVTEALAIFVILGGVYLAYRGLVGWEDAQTSYSIRRVLGGSLSSRRDLKIGVVAALVYAVVYLFASSVVVFQPGVDFGTIYGVTSPSWTAAACCGSVGTVPALVVYVAPQLHMALQLLPLDVLFAVVVPILVGMNVTVAAHAVREREVRKNVGWLGSVGLLTGLFTGCPTCAGLFLASAVGGLGATSLAIALAPYQMLFVMVSIPLLVASPLVIAYSAVQAERAACALPQPPPSRS